MIFFLITSEIAISKITNATDRSLSQIVHEEIKMPGIMINESQTKRTVELFTSSFIRTSLYPLLWYLMREPIPPKNPKRIIPKKSSRGHNTLSKALFHAVKRDKMDKKVKMIMRVA